MILPAQLSMPVLYSIEPSVSCSFSKGLRNGSNFMNLLAEKIIVLESKDLEIAYFRNRLHQQLSGQQEGEEIIATRLIEMKSRGQELRGIWNKQQQNLRNTRLISQRGIERWRAKIWKSQ